MASEWMFIAGKSTEELEEKLKQLSTSITADRDKLTDDQSLFQSISVELKNRRETKDEQPARCRREARARREVPQATRPRAE